MPLHNLAVNAICFGHRSSAKRSAEASKLPSAVSLPPASVGSDASQRKKFSSLVPSVGPSVGCGKSDYCGSGFSGFWHLSHQPVVQAIKSFRGGTVAMEHLFRFMSASSSCPVNWLLGLERSNGERPLLDLLLTTSFPGAGRELGLDLLLQLLFPLEGGPQLLTNCTPVTCETQRVQRNTDDQSSQKMINSHIVHCRLTHTHTARMRDVSHTSGPSDVFVLFSALFKAIQTRLQTDDPLGERDQALASRTSGAVRRRFLAWLHPKSVRAMRTTRGTRAHRAKVWLGVALASREADVSMRTMTASCEKNCWQPSHAKWQADLAWAPRAPSHAHEICLLWFEPDSTRQAPSVYGTPAVVLGT